MKEEDNAIITNDKLFRCDWADKNNIEKDYHDNEWGQPLHNDIKLFEALSLEGLSAGRNRITMLYHRDELRSAFDNFDFNIVAKYDQSKVNEIMKGSTILKDRLKVHAVLCNAKAVINVVEKNDSFDSFLWEFVNNSPIIGSWDSIKEIPLITPLAEEISAKMQEFGFKFVGPPTVYSFLQAVGVVNDHISSCYLHKSL